MSDSIKESSAEQDNLRLQNEKLLLEISKLKDGHNVKWSDRVANYLPLISTVLALSAFVVGILQYANGQEAEFRKPFWEKQIEVYIQLSETAATIATLPEGDDEREKAEATFRKLYYGQMVLIEDKKVMEAKMAFSECLEEEDPACDTSSMPKREHYLKQYSLELANSCRLSLGESWNIPLKGLYNQAEKS